VAIAAGVGLLVGLLAHQLAVLALVLGFVLVIVGVLLTLTALGAVIGIPLMLLGAAEIALGALATGGAGPAIVLGGLVGLVTYSLLRRREERAAA